ncbi:reverse transcriptase [Phytophthora megakarya]|uniref:Reverse transcriptase n=1 Tax=Phytophthora megakarya TaxID=4795 RepID=A0A225WRN2_9STRA|nr:reverse transcriptase [Phytophthora megakarya]
MESVSSHSSHQSKHERDEDPDDLFDLDASPPGDAAVISTATTGTSLACVRLSVFSELKEFNGCHSSEEKARAWFNRLKSASRRDAMTGDEVGALFGDLMAGPARQWYLQLTKTTRKPWTELTDQFRIQHCGKGYLYRINVAGMRVKIHYADRSPEEKREHVELFINTLRAQEQELAKAAMKKIGPSCSWRATRRSLKARDTSLLRETRDSIARSVGTAGLVDTQKETVGACSRVRSAEVSILDTTFAREVGCQIDTSVTQECIRDETYFTVGRTRIKITLAGDLVGQHAIPGMDFMVPAGVRIDAADGTTCLPDEVRIQLIGRRPLYGSKMRAVNIPSLTRIVIGDSYDVPLSPDKMAPKLWVTREVTWVTSMIKARVGRRTYLRVTNVGEKAVILDAHTTIAWWTPVDTNLAFGATAEVNDGELFQGPETPMTVRREYQDPKSILLRTETEAKTGSERRGPVVMTAVVERGSTGGQKEMTETRDADALKSEPAESQATKTPDDIETQDLKLEEIPEYENADAEEILHEGSELFAEDLEAEMAVLPEIPLIADVKIADLKTGRPADVDLNEASKGVVCDIDVGNAKPIAQRVRKISSQFPEKLADLIRGLLSVRMVRASKSPWVSPIVIIVKKNGVDIRLCVDYRIVNSLTQLMAHVAFITPFGLFEWLRMPFGLCNAPQVYQPLIDNALYGFWKLSPTGDTRDVFNDGDPAMPGTSSVLGRRSDIDDILIGDTTWDDLCEKVERLLEVCEEWHLSISVEKSGWGSLNYYHKFIPEFAIYATTLYSLSERDFGEYVTNPKARNQEKWPVVMLYASDWAISAVLAQEHDGVYMAVKFTSRTLKLNELNYNITEKKILALLRVLNDDHTMLVGKTIRVLTR